MAVILSCIDSRTPAEHIFDLGIGDIFSVRIAGHVTREKVLASIEYSCKVAGAKLIVGMGHTSCGAVASAVTLKIAGQKGSEATGCDNLDVLMDEIQIAIDPAVEAPDPASAEFQAYADDVAHKNVLRTIDVICSRSQAISGL